MSPSLPRTTMNNDPLTFPVPHHPGNMAIDLRVNRDGIILRGDGPADAVVQAVTALAFTAGAAAGAWLAAQALKHGPRLLAALRDDE